MNLCNLLPGIHARPCHDVFAAMDFAPQTTWLRKATFQLHLWSGIGIGLYVLLVS